MIETGHRGEATRIESFGVLLGDKCVGVGWVAHHQNLHVLLRTSRERLTLWFEDATVRAEQVRALHALLAGHSPNQQSDVGVTEGHVGIVGSDDAGEQRERAIVEFHLHAFERLERRRDLEQLQDHRGVGSEHRSTGDTEKEAVSDLTGGTGHGNTYGGSHGPQRRSNHQSAGSSRPIDFQISAA